MLSVNLEDFQPLFFQIIFYSYIFLLFFFFPGNISDKLLQHSGYWFHLYDLLALLVSLLFSGY